MKRLTICGSCKPQVRLICTEILNIYLNIRYHGGWLAPNIYFLGFAGCVQVNGVRIAGASGIFSAPHYSLGE